MRQQKFSTWKQVLRESHVDNIGGMSSFANNVLCPSWPDITAVIQRQVLSKWQQILRGGRFNIFKAVSILGQCVIHSRSA